MRRAPVSQATHVGAEGVVGVAALLQHHEGTTAGRDRRAAPPEPSVVTARSHIGSPTERVEPERHDDDRGVEGVDGVEGPASAAR